MLRLWEVRDDCRKALRRLVEPEPGATRRLPAGPYRGITVATDPASSPEVAYSGDMWFGLWESELAPHFRRLCRPGMRCVEVGSLHAVYAMMFAKLCQAPVITYEPDPLARARCERNLALNPELARWVEIRPVGVGNGLEGVTLDQDLAGERVDLVLIDVFPGGEVDVLTGATRLFADQRPHLIVECHSHEWERACGDLLIGEGYQPLVVTRRRLLRQNIAPVMYASWLVA